MKFVQISTARLANNAATQANWILHALDDEGRIWELDDQHGWREVPLPIPNELDKELTHLVATGALANTPNGGEHRG